jgi:lipopolysaccharide/colanic/teichoic acid biosynthesis glycosyltransferase
MKNLIVEKCGENAYRFFSKFIDVESADTLVVSTTNVFNVLYYKNSVKDIINLSRSNDIRFLNKFYETVNIKLKKEGRFICCLETFTARRDRKPIKKIPVVRSIYFGFEFIFMRVFPKLPLFKKFYFYLTRGRNRLLSKAEVFGRLASCGFEIVDYESFNGLMYIVAQKVDMPAFNMNPSYGPLYKMPRMGKNGKIIGVYKFRTMHPYAEYLQDYILKVHGYAESGKPANDFRLTPWGKFLRRYWLDELPQLINVLKGDLKLVGVRPISERYFKDIPHDLQELRLRQKPGCIPPYVSLDRKPSVEAVLQAEREYLIEKTKRPYTTDTRYFFKAIFNIVFRRKRSA